MKKIYLFLLLLCLQQISAQFTENDVKFWVGTGSKKAYFIADFNDSDNPTSYAWGFRYDANNLTMEDLINAIDAVDSKLETEVPSGFLYSINYNHHTPSLEDYWSTWSGPTAENMHLNNGANNDPLVDGKWYGASFGYGSTPTTPPLSHPSPPVAAYNFSWYNSSQITNWIGTGNNTSLVIIDFGTSSSAGEAHSFVFGIKYNGSLNAEQALQLIHAQAPYFNFTSGSNKISTLSLNNFTGNASGTNTWKLFKGKDLSSWRGQTNLSQIQLGNNDWLGLSFGQRQPFTPREASNLILGVSENSKKEFRIYPNPASDFIRIENAEDLKEVNIYAVSGQKVLTGNTTKINIQTLKAGIYLVEIKTSKNTTVHKIIKK
ncbi:Por secretion system C-terminal sorting domain-containing protein [Chryseobacterium oleae]|uniref:Por secretion system C-terminal sorting domain-containing protein n=1 Tax=Chryseobacterium oleae TaxID=491207 RepID=A0A1I4XIR8_CHROL|nr:T9SS type A sorting domain-containing protein [Chryseobacterium oleae]SFN25828.1 Por secretion system C-terminal sorting domain-containing protein [Chryseobacterium oleae]